MKQVLRSLRFISLVAVVFISLTTAFLFFYSEQIKNILLTELDNNIKEEVTVDIKNVHLTWWAHFPNISLELKDVTISQEIRKQQDTLINMKEIGLGLDISQLLSNDFTIEKIFLKQGKVDLKLFDGKFNNYSIFNKKTKDSTSTQITFELEKVDIKKVEFSYQDLREKHLYNVFFKDNTLKLKYSDDRTESKIQGGLMINKIIIKGNEYFSNRPVNTNIKLIHDTKRNKFRLNNSSITINGGRFDLDGHFIANEKQELDLSFKAHESKISVLSSLIPNSIAQEINKYKTKGNVYFDGKIKGYLMHHSSPAIDVNFGFKNASFYDPETKQNITQANLRGTFTNGRLRNSISTKLFIDDFSAKIQGGTARGNFKYINFSDPQVDINLEADVPFASLINLIGKDHFNSPKGQLIAKVNLKAPLKLLLTDRQNPKIVSKGELKIENVSFGINNSDLDCKNINGHFLINKTDLGIINFGGSAGKSDFKIDGIINQFLPFVFGYGDELHLQGGFKSRFLDLDQLLSQNVSTKSDKNIPKQNYNFKISPWLSFDLDCSFEKVKFRKLKGNDELKNLNGNLHLKNQLFTYDYVHFTVASGKFENKGYINAQKENDIKIFNQCNLSNLNVKEFLYVFENFNQDFITDKNLKGKIKGSLNSTLYFDQALHLDVNRMQVNSNLTITYGELLNFAPLQEMGKYIKKKKYQKFVQNSDLNKIVFSELNTEINVINGMILIPKTTIKNSVSRINLSGTHSLKNEINYKIDFPLVNYKKLEKDSEIDESKYVNIFMEISGTTSDYKVNVKENQILKDLGKVIVNNITEDDPVDEKQVIELDTEDDENTIDIE